MYPIKFTKVFKDKIWGGRQLEELLKMQLPDNKNYGESWEVSTHKNGMSVVENGQFKGQTLELLIEKFGKDILGEEIISKYDGEFPLLIKYLDINEKLSVQVHPNDEYAQRVEGEFGKYESWYILDASDDAKIILGFDDGITKEEYNEKVKKGDFTNLFKEVKVKKGDFIDIIPGLVHASLDGSIVICEVQQNSDTTYRIFDFDRVVNGEKRELHIEKSLDVIDFSIIPKISSIESRNVKMIKNGYIDKLSSNNYYNIDRIKLNDGTFNSPSYKNFKIQSIIGGQGYLEYNNEVINLTKGETYFIPSNLAVTINGDIEILESYI